MAAETVTSLEMLRRLVAFDTTSRNSNLELIAWVEAYLAVRGVESWRVENDEGSKANLYSVIGPMVEGGVILSGHTDVVPVDGQPWSSPPFTLTERDNRLYGRGVADMKSFIAASLAHVDTAVAAPLKHPIILAFTYDEEVGCIGAPRLVSAIAKKLPRPRAAIIGEPTEMAVVSGHKGIATFHVRITGREAHSSQTTQGVSAIMAAAPLMNLIAEMGTEAAALADPNSPFLPPGPTMTIGTIEGGTAVNILARHCHFVWDLRTPPGVDPMQFVERFKAKAAEVEASMRVIAPEATVEVTQRSFSPALSVVPDSPAEQLVRTLTGDNALRVVAFATEGGLFQGAGFPTVICGPGSIAQAHQPDEWIALDQLPKANRFLGSLIDHLCQ
jgi:acetylornithine deacetylase